MGKSQRLKLGIILNFSSQWMGGVIYIINVVKILNWLDEDKKPEVKLFYRPDLKRFVDEIDYPYLEAIPWSFADLKSGYLRSWLNRKNLFIEPILEHRQLDALFPVMDFPVRSKTKVSLISWFADLQHKHYPVFFSKRKLLERDARIQFILKNCKELVLSSQSVLDDFHRFFNLQGINTHIFHFASVIDNFDFSGWEKLRSNKGLPRDYFMVSNQFHKHKNHQIILEALGLLKQRGLKPTIAFTGRMPRAEHSAYIEDLYQIIENYNIADQVVFLGVLSRHDQLTLMRYAQAIIQPSLFEGWSTVIEDAISLQTPVIASNLPVNKEQLGNWAPYFEPNKAEQLAKLIEKQPIRENFDTVIYEPYNDRIRKAAETFISVFK